MGALPRELVGTGGIFWCLDRSRSRVKRTLVNLSELGESGFGAVTQMSGSPGGGRSGGRTMVIDTERVPVSGVEAAVLAGPQGDEAGRALMALRSSVAGMVDHAGGVLQLVAGARPRRPVVGPAAGVLHAWRCALVLQAGALDDRWQLPFERRVWSGWLGDARQVERICDRWGFTPGVPSAPAKARTSATDGLAVDLTELWCRNCLGHGHRSPRSDRYATAGLCRRCGDFHAHEGFHPSAEVVDAWSAGRRLTAAMVDGARAEHRLSRKRRR